MPEVIFGSKHYTHTVLNLHVHHQGNYTSGDDHYGNQSTNNRQYNG